MTSHSEQFYSEPDEFQPEGVSWRARAQELQRMNEDLIREQRLILRYLQRIAPFEADDLLWCDQVLQGLVLMEVELRAARVLVNKQGAYIATILGRLGQELTKEH